MDRSWVLFEIISIESIYSCHLGVVVIWWGLGESVVDNSGAYFVIHHLSPFHSPVIHLRNLLRFFFSRQRETISIARLKGHF